MRTLPLFILLFCNACTLDETRLYGHWQAAAFYQNGQTLDADLSAVSLDFLPSGRYSFQSSARYSEAGLFRNSGHYLFLTDTTASPNKEHTIKVLFLSEDSLKIKMEKAGQAQFLFLYRHKID